MHSGLLTLFGIWLGVLLFLVLLTQTGLCKEKEPGALKAVWKDIEESVKDTGKDDEKPEKSAPVPPWCYQLWPSAIQAFVYIALTMASPFAIMNLSPRIQNLLMHDPSDVLVGTNVGWATLPAFFMMLVTNGLIIKILMTPFPICEAYSVIYTRVTRMILNVPPEQRAKLERRLLTEAYRRLKPRDVAHNQWLPTLQITAAMWAITMPLYFLLLNEYVRVSNDGVFINSRFSFAEKKYPFDRIEYAYIKEIPGQFDFGFRDGTQNINIWKEPLIFGQFDSKMIAIAKILRSHNVAVVVPPDVVIDSRCLKVGEELKAIAAGVTPVESQ